MRTKVSMANRTLQSVIQSPCDPMHLCDVIRRHRAMRFEIIVVPTNDKSLDMDGDPPEVRKSCWLSLLDQLIGCLLVSGTLKFFPNTGNPLFYSWYQRQVTRLYTDCRGISSMDITARLFAIILLSHFLVFGVHGTSYPVWFSSVMKHVYQNLSCVKL